MAMNQQLQRLRSQLGNPSDEDDVLEYCLERASDIICDIRNSDKVEKKYLTTQIAIAIEIYNKRGAEGQTSHTENGISRVYASGDISHHLIRKITPVAKTPSSKVRVIEE